MAKLTLIFAVLATIVTAIQLGVNGQVPVTDFNASSAEEESSDRGGMASASAKATAHSSAHGPNPGPPRPYPVVPTPCVGVECNQVTCYSCSGCPDPRNATLKLCPETGDPTRNKKCVVYGETYYNSKEPWVVRACASERGNCNDIKPRMSQQLGAGQVIWCRDCDGDKCNGAGHSTLDLLAALTAMVMTPLLMKHTLS